MKAKIKLDPNAIKRFFIDHMEKMLFGLVVVCFLLLVYQAVARDTLKWGPEDLVRDADDAKKNVAATKASPPQYDSYTRIAADIRKPIAETDYTLKTVWEPLKFDENIPRGVPKLYSVTDLRCGAGDGAFAMAPPQQDEDEAVPMGPTRGQRWAVVTGLIQHRKQREAYDATFQEAAQWDPQRDYPDYVFYRVERAEVDPRSETAEPKWTTVRVRDMLALQELWMRSGGEVVDGAYLPPPRGSVAIAFPLGPLQDREWGPEVAHLPEIPVVEAGERGGGMPGRRSNRGGASAAARGQGAAKGAEGDAEAGEEPAKSDDAAKKAAAEKRKKTRKKSADEPDEPDAFEAAGGGSAGSPAGASRTARNRGSMATAGSMSGMMPGSMPGMMGGGPGGMGPGTRAGARTRRPADAEEEKVEEKELEYLLFRFFDFTVQPGKHYRYRVKLVLANPNHGMMSHYLEKDGMEKPQYLESEWSEPSPEVSVPLDSQALTVSAKASDGSASMMLVRFNMDDGACAREEVTVPRGQLLDYRQRPLSRAAAGRTPLGESETEEKKVDYLTNSLLLDVAGGARLPGKDRNLLEPGSVLLLDPEGALVVRSELDDLSEIELRKQPETGKGRFAGGGGGPLAGGEPPAPGGKGSKTGKGSGKKGGPKGGGSSGSAMPGMPGMTPGMMMPGMMPGAGTGVGDLDDGPKRSKSGRKRGG